MGSHIEVKISFINRQPDFDDVRAETDGLTKKISDMAYTVFDSKP